MIQGFLPACGRLVGWTGDGFSCVFPFVSLQLRVGIYLELNSRPREGGHQPSVGEHNNQPRFQYSESQPRSAAQSCLPVYAYPQVES